MASRRCGPCAWVLGVALAMACAPTTITPLPASRTQEELSADDLTLHVRALADDSMLGRESGTDGNMRATAYIARELARIGVEPAGEAGTYFQTVPLAVRLPDHASVLLAGDIVIRGDGDLLPLRPFGGAPLGGRFDGAAVETVYGGRLGGTLISPDSVRGRVVVFGARIGADGQPVRQILGVPGTVFDAYRNVAGVLIAGLEGLPGGAINFLRQPTMVLPATMPPPGIAAARIGTRSAERLMGRSLDSLAIGARGLRVAGSFGFIERQPPALSRNVIAVVRGRDPALRATYVAVGSHSDHVGLAPVALDHDSVFAFNRVLRRSGANEPPRTPNGDPLARIRDIRDSLRAMRPSRRDSIFNGADDDASAVAVALELAEYFLRHPARRSILLVFHTAEEKGLFGASHFTDHPTVPRDSIIAQVNMDQVSRGGPEDIEGAARRTLFVLGSRRISTPLGDLVDRLNRQPQNRFTLDYSLDAPSHPANAYCRSDHYMYARYGIPVVFLSAGWHPDYHMVTDEAQYARADVMLGVAGFVRDIVQSVADLGERLVRDRPAGDPGAPCRQ